MSPHRGDSGQVTLPCHVLHWSRISLCLNWAGNTRQVSLGCLRGSALAPPTPLGVSSWLLSRSVVVPAPGPAGCRGTGSGAAALLAGLGFVEVEAAGGGCEVHCSLPPPPPCLAASVPWKTFSLALLQWHKIRQAAAESPQWRCFSSQGQVPEMPGPLWRWDPIPLQPQGFPLASLTPETLSFPLGQVMLVSGDSRHSGHPEFICRGW